MDFTIYSIGNTEFLYEVIMGLRRMFDFGFSSLHILVGATALLSLMALVVKSWINPNSNPVQSWFIGLFMFMLLCGPMSKVDVTIESIRTGQVYYVDDAPGIVAIAAMMTSGMYGLSRDYEDSFASTDGYLAGQFLDPMRALISLDNFGYLSAEETESGLDLQKYSIQASMNNYLIDCAIWDMQLGGSDAEIKAEDLKNANIDELLDAIKVNSPSRSTYIHINSPSFEYLTCPNAYNKIRGYLYSNDFNDVVDHFLQKQNLNPLSVPDGINTITAGMSSMSAYEVARGRYLSSKIAQASQAVGDKFALRGEITLIETKSQRHYQMASDRNLTLELSIGFVTFLEAFVFFLIPVMAIMLVMGADAMKGVAMFFGVTIWVNLWPVTMSAINLFTLLALQGRFTDGGSGGGSISATTFGMWGNTIATIESYIAVASALAAAVPMITLYILHRGVHTMMGVSSKTTPDTNIDSKKMSPDITTAANAGSTKEADTQIMASTTAANLDQHKAAIGQNDVSINPSAGKESGYLKNVAAESSRVGASSVQQQDVEKQSASLQSTASESRAATLSAVKDYKTGQSTDSVDLSNLSEDEAYMASQTMALMDKHGLSHSDAYEQALQIEAGAGVQATIQAGKTGSKSLKHGNTRSTDSTGASAGLSGKAAAAIRAKGAAAKQVSSGNEFSDDERAQMAETLKQTRSSSIKAATTQSASTGQTNTAALSRTEGVVNAYTDLNELQASKAEGETASIASKIGAAAHTGEIQNAQTGAGKHSIPGIVDGLSDKSVHQALGSLVGTEGMKGLNKDEKREKLASILSGDESGNFDRGNFQFHKDRLNTGDNARLPEAQKNNIALASTVSSLAGRMSQNRSVLGVDENGKNVPMSSKVTALNQANAERVATGEAINGLAKELGSASLYSVGDELISSAGAPNARNGFASPINTTGVDAEKLSSAVSEGIKTDPTANYNHNDSNNAVNAHANNGSGQVEQSGLNGMAQVESNAGPIKKETDSMNANKLGSAFESMKLLSGKANNLGQSAIGAIGSLFTSSVGENVTSAMVKNGTGANANGDLLVTGYGILANNTPEAIKNLLNSAAEGKGAIINGNNLSPSETQLYAGAVSAAMQPEALAGFNDALNLQDAKIAQQQPNNPYRNAKDNIAAIQNMNGSERLNTALDEGRLLATYASLANLSRSETADAVKAMNGESTFLGLGDQNYARHLGNLNALSEQMGGGKPYDPSQYSGSDKINSGNLESHIVGGNFDPNASALARMAIANYNDTGLTTGVDFNDLIAANIEQLRGQSGGPSGMNLEYTQFDESAIADLNKIANGLEAAGMSGQAMAIRNSLSNISGQEQTRVGYGASQSRAYENAVVSNGLNMDGVSQSSKDFASNAIYGTGNSSQLSSSDLGDVNKIISGLSGAPDAQYKLSTATLSEFPSNTNLQDSFNKADISADVARQASDILTYGAGSSSGNYSEVERQELTDLADTLEANNLLSESVEIRNALER